ncbi:hypothetical protein CC79DRAFT_1397249 [Sarocladium strictum]
MMLSATSLLPCAASLLALLTQGALAQDDDSVRFTYPDKDGLAFFQRDAVTVSYISDIKNASLWTFCREPKEGSEDETEVIFKGKIEEAAPMNGSQEVRINFNTNADQCWFNLRDNDDDGLGFNSPQFSLSSDERSQTTLGLGESEASTTALPATFETTSVVSSTAASETTSEGNSQDNQDENNDSSSSDGLSTGAKAGIGVGVALGVIGIVAFVAVFIMLRKRKANNDAGTEHERQELQSNPVVENKHHWGGAPVEQGPPQEMSAGFEPERRAGAHEMPG